MSPRRTTARRLVAPRVTVPAVGVAAALLLGGCGIGQKAQTYQERTVGDATNTAVGSIAVRNIAVLGPRSGVTLTKGSDAQLVFTMVNDGPQDDVLLSASTPAATSVVISGPTPRLQLPRLTDADPRYTMTLNGLTRDLQTGEYVDLTLEFQRNGTRSLLVPVQVTPEGAPRPSSTYAPGETDSANKPIVSGDNVPDGGGSVGTKGDQGTLTPPGE